MNLSLTHMYTALIDYMLKSLSIFNTKYLNF